MKVQRGKRLVGYDGQRRDKAQTHVNNKQILPLHQNRRMEE